MINDEDMIPLSGIQHYLFCPRQWALIHIDQIWSDNYLTTEGSILHENVDDPFYRQKNGTGIITIRGFRLSSSKLGLSGIADAIEIHPIADHELNLELLLKQRTYHAVPVEYKRGTSKLNDCDRVQVAAQAMILEEMLGIHISQGAIFYWQDRHREYFEITDQLRIKVEESCMEMKAIFESKKLPSCKYSSQCRSCSLNDRCQPKLQNKRVNQYIKEMLNISDEEIT